MRKHQDFGSYLQMQQNSSTIIVFGDIPIDFLKNVNKDLETKILASVNNQNLH